MSARILHVDLDAFFVEVCRQRNPELRDVELLVVTRVLVDVEDGGVPATVLVVGRPGRAMVVVVVVVSAGSCGHAVGAGAFRAANFPGSSRRTSPPKSRQ